MYVLHAIIFRFDKHMMMVLAHGKVTEHPARLALAEGMLKVYICSELSFFIVSV